MPWLTAPCSRKRSRYRGNPRSVLAPSLNPNVEGVIFLRTVKVLLPLSIRQRDGAVETRCPHQYTSLREKAESSMGSRTRADRHGKHQEVRQGISQSSAVTLRSQTSRRELHGVDVGMLPASLEKHGGMQRPREDRYTFLGGRSGVLGR